MNNPHVNECVIISDGNKVNVIPANRKHEKSCAHDMFDAVYKAAKSNKWRKVNLKENQVGSTGYLDKPLEANTYGTDPHGRRYVSFHLVNCQLDRQRKFVVFERYAKSDNGPIVSARQAPFASGALSFEVLEALHELVGGRQYVSFPEVMFNTDTDFEWQLEV
jgi:hypothetical protein